MTTSNRPLLIFLLLIIASVDCMGAGKIVHFNNDNWEINADRYRFEEYLGQESLAMECDLPVNCFALVKDSNFRNGVIEFDIAVERGRGFMGFFWRLKDKGNLEEFYIRPHNSGKDDSNQYTPVFNGLAAWQLYYGVEYSAPTKYRFNAWMHVRMMVSGTQAEIYINDMNVPALFIPELKREIRSGKVGLKVDLGRAHYANFRFTTMNNPPLKGKAVVRSSGPGNVVKSWLVSGSFDEKNLQNKIQLTVQDKDKLKWKEIHAEDSGLVNISRVSKYQRQNNSTFVRIKIDSLNAQVKRMMFGYSDRVRVYLNDRLIYGGDNTFRSRDYRFLGTIGYFDDLYLPLSKGKNELWFAVSETFGGWGLQAKFENLEGIQFIND